MNCNEAGPLKKLKNNHLISDLSLNSGGYLLASVLLNTRYRNDFNEVCAVSSRPSLTTWQAWKRAVSLSGPPVLLEECGQKDLLIHSKVRGGAMRNTSQCTLMMKANMPAHATTMAPSFIVSCKPNFSSLASNRPSMACISLRNSSNLLSTRPSSCFKSSLSAKDSALTSKTSAKASASASAWSWEMPAALSLFANRNVSKLSNADIKNSPIENILPFLLTQQEKLAHASLATDTSVVGFESSNKKGAQLPRIRLRGFFASVRSASSSFMVAQAGASSDAPVPFFRSFNPVRGRHLCLKAKVAGYNPAKKESIHD